MAEYHTEDLHTWTDFVQAVEDLKAQMPALRAQRPHSRIPDVLFRGQREADWGLETTLERYRPASLTFRHYYTSIWAAKSQIESHTGQRWEIPSLNEYLEKTRDPTAGAFFSAHVPAYDYLAYRRHHGFPSPLLDWTGSAYVAAFFAFREAGDDTGRVAIYAYRRTATGGWVAVGGEPTIDLRGPYVRTHRRHFLQQCQYTVCAAFTAPEWQYTSHDTVFAGHQSSLVGQAGQDQLWKFTLPRSERKHVLAYLDEHNLNAYSLFGSDEGLMEMMARRELL
jgi:FRG domain